MTDSSMTSSQPAAAPQRPNLIRSVLKDPLGLLATAIITVVVLTAIFAPVIAPNDPTAVQIFKVNTPPGDGYLLGGDGSGRDIFSRIVFGARNTLLGALVAIGVAATIGVTTGLFAGYFGRRFEMISSWISDGLMALPALIVLLALYQSLGASIYLSMAVFGVMLSPGFYRLTRTLVKAVRGELYIDAARVSGLGDLRIIRRHILLAVREPIVIQTSIVGGIAIVIQAGLEFLGLGDPGTPTWGGILQGAFENMYVSPMGILWPGLAISLTVGAMVLLANAIRDSLRQTGSTRAPALPAKAEAKSPVPATDVLLDVRDLVVGYPDGGKWREVVRGVTLQVKRGEVLGLVGESGSGKSQTAFAILDLLSTGGRVLSGSIVFDGQDLTRATEKQMREIRGRKLAYVPQEPMSNLDPMFRIGQQLIEPLMDTLGLSKAEATERALKMLARVGLPDPERTFRAYPHQISGGMAQRVLIAGAVASGPTLLIADEPTTALDVTVQAEVLELLRELREEFDMTIVMVTHNFGVVADICDRVAVMHQGQIVEENEATQLFANPQQSYTQMLLGSVLEDPKTRTYVAPAAKGAKA